MLRLGAPVVTGVMLAAALVVPGPASAARPLPSYLELDPSVRQLVTVTSDHWSDTRARLSVWRRSAAEDGGWTRARGPVRVRLAWNGWVRAAQRRQSTGTTPAGSVALEYAFGNRPDPGARLRYVHADRDDVWPYEPRDPATYNILQPRQASGSRWRPDHRERLRAYGREYAHALVLGFNLPHGVHWSAERRQHVADRPADTRRGGGIFLHVQGSRNTAGCVAAPLRDVRWLVRHLDPAHAPRIAMGPTSWVKRAL